MRESLKAQHDRDRIELLRSRLGSGADLEPPAREATGALAPGARLDVVCAALKVARPRAAVVDDLLNPAAFRWLQQYLMFGDVWREVADGMLAARPDALLESPLIHQIGEELRTGAPELFDPYPRVSYWAFKSLRPTMGAGVHADAAAVTVNLWLTDDSANRDPTAGGLVVWDATPATDWERSEYNAGGAEHQAAIRRYLASRTPFRLHIPYRANRAVVFQSTLFHESDAVNFCDSFACRRINLTLLFS